MATEAQVQANRSNAQKSTGPRSAEGKAAVAQNAVKHGFAGRLDVIKGEEQAEFDLHREAMLGELAPAGAVETMLAERIAGLSWRLKRAERMQEEAFNALLTPDTSSLAVRIGQSFRPKRSEAEAQTESELAFGRAVVKDFGHDRVLDRLLMYERRMEHSLYRTMAELQRQRLLREVDGPAQEPACSVPVRASEETPHGVTTNKVGRGRPTYEETPDGPRVREGRLTNALAGAEPPHHSGIPSFQYAPAAPASPVAAEKSCKTKPIGRGANDSQIPCGTGVMTDSVQKGLGKTKPISPGTARGATPEGCPDGFDVPANQALLQAAAAGALPQSQ